MAQRETTQVTINIESAKISAKDIEARTGLKPDISWMAGDSRGAFGARAKNHGFVLESALGPNDSLDRHMAEMAKRLIPYAQKLGALAAELDIEYNIALHRRQAPAIDIPRADLHLMAVIGARLRVDTQVISDQPRGGAAPAKPETPGGGTTKSF